MLQVGERLAGKRLVCIVRATTVHLHAAYLGCAASKPLHVVNPFTTVRYFVDGASLVGPSASMSLPRTAPPPMRAPSP